MVAAEASDVNSVRAVQGREGEREVHEVRELLGVEGVADQRSIVRLTPAISQPCQTPRHVGLGPVHIRDTPRVYQVSYQQPFLLQRLSGNRKKLGSS